MARPRNSVPTIVKSDQLGIAVELPPHNTGELITIIVTKDDATGGALSVTAGWSILQGVFGTSGNNSIRSAVIAKIAVSSSEPYPEVTSADSDTWSAVATVWEGVDTVTPFGTIASVTGTTVGTGNPYTALAITTAANNSCVYYAISSDGSTAATAPMGIPQLGWADSGADGAAAAFTFQRVAGLTPACAFVNTGQADESVVWTLEIRDGSGGTILPAYPNLDCGSVVRPLAGNSLPYSGDSIDTNSDAFSALAGTWQNPTRVLQVSAGGATIIDITAAATDAIDADTLPFPVVEAVGDYIAIGFSSPIIALRLDRAGCTAGVGGGIAKEYVSSSGVRKALPEFFDAFSNLTSAVGDHQIFGWTLPSDWTAQTIGGFTEYWVVFRCTTVYTTNPTISQIFVSTSPALQHDVLTGRSSAGVTPWLDSMNVTPPAAGNLMSGGAYMMASTRNLASSLIMGTFILDSPADVLDMSRRSEGGVAVGLIDSSNLVKAWTVASFDSADTYSEKRGIFCIQANQSTNTSFISNSPNLALAKRILLMTNNKFGAVQISFNPLVEVGTLKIYGGASASPVDMNSILNVANHYPCPLIDRITNTAYCLVQIGGDEPVYAVSDGGSLTWPRQALESNRVASFHVDPGVVGFLFDPRAGGTCKFTNWTWTGLSTIRWEVLATASASADWELSGSVTNANVILRAVTTFSGLTFIRCPLFIQNSSLVDGCVFVITKVTSDDPGKLSNCTFISASTGHALEATTPGTYTSDNIVYTGFGADGTTDAAFYNNSGGLVILNLANYTDVAPTVRNGAGATTIINVLPKNISITGAVSGSRILLRNITATTTPANVVGTGYTATYVEGTTFTTGDVYEVTVTHVDKLEKVYTGVVSAIGISIAVTQDSDTVYAENGFDGSTFTGITFNTTTIDLDLDGSTDPIVLWGEAYARYKYQTTLASGIQNLIGAMFAKDKANYLFANTLVINNLSGTPVRIGGDGFAARRDGASMFGTGTIQIDNSIGVIIAESAEILEIYGKTQGLTFTLPEVLDVNIKAVNDGPIKGTGNAGNRWGPL